MDGREINILPDIGNKFQCQVFVVAVVFVKFAAAAAAAFVVKTTILYQDVYIIRFITILSFIKKINGSLFSFSLKQGSVSRLLTLRLLMSYIYIYIYMYMEHLFLMFLDHTQRRTTVDRTPLDE